jgi:putative IMPACT (imprinted ancient) family translation regulator
VLVVVTRWFGGTRLGAGGLVRAYGGCAAECLRTAEVLEVRPRIALTVTVPFDDIGVIYPVFEQHEATRTGERFDENGAIVEVELDADAREAFTAALGDATRGRARVVDSTA